MTEPVNFRITLLGTGTPVPRPDRFGPSTLVEAGDQKLLIEAGRGATMRLYQLGIPIGRLDALLLTHYHSDHTSCVADVWLTGWLKSHFGTRKAPFRVIGPTGAKPLMENLERAYAADIKIRIADEKLSPAGVSDRQFVYGPGTSLNEGSEIVDQVRRRRLPIVGRGGGIWSFVHISPMLHERR